MKTLIDHVENLSKFTEDKPEVILQSILLNDLIIDEDTLLAYFIDRVPWETSVMVTWADGDSKKIIRWLRDICKRNGCTKMKGITQRCKAFERKYGAKPIGVLMEREAF